MAIFAAPYLQPYPTITDLKSQGLGVSLAGLGGDVPLLSTLKAREIGLNIPGLPANATVAEAQVYTTLVNLAITEANLRRAFSNLESLIIQNKPVPCKALLAHNALVDDFRDLAAKVVSKFLLAGLGPKIQTFPQLPPKFEIDQRCILNANAVVGGALGIAPIIWAAGLLVVAVGITGGVLLLASKWDDIAESSSVASRAASLSEIERTQTEVWALALSKCKEDTACIAKVSERMPNDLTELRKLANELKPKFAESHGALWWAGVVGVVGLAGAGIYAYKNRKG